MIIGHGIAVKDSSRIVLVCFIKHLLIFLIDCFFRLTFGFLILIFEICYIDLFRRLITRDTILESVVNLLVIVLFGSEFIKLIVFPCLISHDISITLHKCELFIREVQIVDHNCFQSRSHLLLVVGALRS